MLSCKEACESATEYLDGEPTFGQRMSMRLHLLLCKHCRRFYQQFKITTGAAARLDEAPSPTDAEIDALVEKLSIAHKQSQD